MGLRWEQSAWNGWRAYDWDTDEEVFYTQTGVKRSSQWRVWKKGDKKWTRLDWLFPNAGEAKHYCEKWYRDQTTPKPVRL